MERDDHTPAAADDRAAALKRFTFFGSYDHSIDAKGRLIIPGAYRDMLGETFTVSVTRDGEGIAIYPDEVFDEMLLELSQLNQRSLTVQRYQSYLAKMSFRGMQTDNQGRLLLPAKLKQYVLGESKNVEVSGAIDHIRVEEAAHAGEGIEYFHQHRVEILDEIAGMKPDT